MKLFSYGKDGGPESKVWGFWFIEIKWLFSIVLLKFDLGTRPAFHNHAFNCYSWLLSGRLMETVLKKSSDGSLRCVNIYVPSVFGFPTYRDTFHQVEALTTSYVLSFRGPWSDTWDEYIPEEDKTVTLTHGRKVIE